MKRLTLNPVSIFYRSLTILRLVPLFSSFFSLFSYVDFGNETILPGFNDIINSKSNVLILLSMMKELFNLRINAGSLN